LNYVDLTDDERSNFASDVAVYGFIVPLWTMGDTISDFSRESSRSPLYVIPLRRSPWETVPRGKPNGKFSRPNAIKVERGADEI